MLKNKNYILRNKKLICLKWLLIFLFTATGYSATAQSESEKGLPFITNYEPKNVNILGQLWSVIQGDAGMMYFGSQNAIIEYDGVKWQKILFDTTAPLITRSMAKDNNGKVYYGGVGDFGYLAKDSIGRTIGISLLKYVPTAYRNFFDIWSVYSSSEGIYFQSREYIFLLGPKNEIKVWKPQSKFTYAFYIDGNYFVHQQGLGLFKLVNDSFQMIPGSEFLGKERMQVMLPYTPPAIDSSSTEKQYLIGLFYSGLYIYNGKSFQPFTCEATPVITATSLYKAIKISDDRYLLATTGKGVVFIDGQGRIVQIIDKEIGLQNESVYAPYLDNTGTLWLGLDNGVSKVDINSPYTQFNNHAGLSTSLLSMKRFKGVIYLGTTNGLTKFNSTTAKFEQMSGMPNQQIFSLVSDSNNLLIANDGLYAVENGKINLVKRSIAGDMQLNSLLQSSKFPWVLYAGSTNGLKIFVKNSGSWKFFGTVSTLHDQVWSFSENKDGSVWAGTQNGIVYRFTPSFDGNGDPELNNFRIEKFGPEQGLKLSSGLVFKIKGESFFPGDSCIYRYDSVEKKFVSDHRFGHFPKHGGFDEFNIAADSTGRVFIDFAKQKIIATPSQDGNYALDTTSLLPIADPIVNFIYPEKNGIIWFGTTDGLIRFDENHEKNYDVPFKTLVRKVAADSNLLNTNIAESGYEIPSIAFNNRNIRFEYTAPYFEQENKTQYQTWLEGFEKTWSPWGNNTYKEYTNLSAGKYKFHVRALNIYKKQSQEATYEFVILSPWYRTWWAYLLYAIAAILIVYFFVNWKVRQLREKHIELEKVVEERTMQLSQRAEELSVINSVQDGLVREMNMQSIYYLVGNRICELFDTQTVIIRTFNHSAGNEEWQFAIERGQKLKSDPRPLIWANKLLISDKQPLLINKNYQEFAVQHGGTGVSKGLPPKSAIFVPMIVKDEVRGSVSLQNVEKENAFSDNDVRLLGTLTNSMSVALENARLFHETTLLLAEAKQRATELGTVNSVSKAIASQLNPDDLIQLVGNQLKDLFKANIVYLALLNKTTRIINFAYQYGEVMPSRKIGDGLTSKILLTGDPLLINTDVVGKAEKLGIQQVGVPAASYLGVPIPVGEEIIGVLSVQSTERENRFNENDLRLLSTIASSVGVSLKNAQLFGEVEQAKREAELSSKTAAKANEAKSAFLSTVSHELRTPLTSVLGFAKIIKKRLEEKIFPTLDKTDSKTEKTVDQISENLKVVISEGERLTHLINDVLDLAKIEAGKMEWNQENVSLAEVIERAAAATTSLFDQKDIKLIKHTDNDVPTIIGDADKLIQVVINLFSNAVKFTDAGSVTCMLSKTNDEVIVSIADTGIGIAKEDFGAVFEQFKQVGGDTLTDKPKGTGLGLPICKEIVEHHGGRIWLESEVGKGSTFSFALPLVQSGKKSQDTPIHLNELMKQLKEQMVFSKIKMAGKNATILVVDDDDSIRSLLHQELSDAGYIIEEARDGKMALESIRKNRPDLIILDVMMPEINGFDVAAILKNDPQTMDIPIIILSIVQDKARGFRIGVDRYLTKPIDTAQLFEEVGNLLEQGKSKKKVMVVDEDSSAVRSLTEVLQAKGYIVVESDGKELVQKAISTQPDIIILNSVVSDKNEIVQSLRFEKGLENVLFLIYQ